MAPIANLTVRLSAQIAEFQSEFKAATKSAQKFADDFEGTATKAAAVGSFFGTIAADIAKSLAAGLGSALKDAVKFSSEFNNAFIGLGSVARAFGTDTDLATTAARKLSADGLLPLKDSATGLKNLLAAGFNLDQSTKLMNAFKDSAAFGRQGALSFGDAIRSATEGVKNGNSILVDNAGVTKNLSQILKEAGFSAQDLSRASSDAGVRMALFNGILKETRAQTGDAQRLTQTYTGQVSRLESQYQQLLSVVGDSITKNQSLALAISAVGDFVQSLTGWLRENGRGFNFVTDAVILAAKTFSAFTTAIDVIHGGLNALDTALRGTVKNMADSVFGLSNMLLQIVTLGSKLPGGGVIVGAYANEISSLAIVTGQAAKTSRDMASQMAANDRSTNVWSQNLGTARAKVNDLVGQLEAARGKTVEFGGETNTASRNTTTLGTSTGHATEKAKEFGLALDHSMIPQVKRLGTEIAVTIPELDAYGQALAKLAALPKGGLIPEAPAHLGVDVGIPQIPTAPAAGFFGSIFGNSAQFGQQMASTILGAIQGGGNPISAAAGMVGSKIGSGIADFVKKDGTKLFTGALGGVMSAALPFVGSLVGPLADAIWGKLFGTKGRDAVKDFAATFSGGFDGPGGLHEALNTLGAEGERLWIKLTQGVGRNNPTQAKMVIDEITAALEKQKAKTEQVAAAATASAALQQEALDGIAAKYNATIDGLKGELGSFSASLQAEQDAPEFDEMGNRIYGVVEAQQMARAAILAGQIKDAVAAREAEIAAKKETFDAMLEAGQNVDKELRELFGKPLDIPYKFVPENSPGGYRPPVSTTPALTGGSSSAPAPSAQAVRVRQSSSALNVTLRLPNNQVLLRQFVSGMESEGLA